MSKYFSGDVIILKPMSLYPVELSLDKDIESAITGKQLKSIRW